MKLTPLKAIRKHQPRLGVESRQVVWNVPDMTRLPDGQERKKSGIVKLSVAYHSHIDLVLIQTGKDAPLRKIPLQPHVLKKVMVIYRCKLFVLKLNVERQEILRKTKFEHTHGYFVSMLKNNCHLEYNLFFAG